MPFGWFKKKTVSPAATATPPAGLIAPAPQRQPAEDVGIPPEKIAARAYEVWVRKGKPHGRDLQNWLDAEAELRTEFAANTEPHTPPRKPR